MKLNYFPETDSLYIDLSEKPSVESQEVSASVVLDYDADGNLAGIDIDHASRKLDLRELVTSHVPLEAKAKPPSTINLQLSREQPSPETGNRSDLQLLQKTFDRMK